MNLTYFNPQKRENVENASNSPVNIRFVAKTSHIRTGAQPAGGQLPPRNFQNIAWQFWHL